MYLNKTHWAILGLAFLSACNNKPTTPSTEKTSTSTDILNYGSIETAGQRDGNRFFRYQGKVLFDSATFYNAQQFSKHGYCAVSKMIDGKERYGVINTQGKTVIEFKYAKISTNTELHFFDRCFEFSEDGKLMGLLDSTGKVLLPAQYDDLGRELKYQVLPVRKNQKWGLINLNQEVVLPFEYNKFGKWADGLLPVQKNYQWGFVDSTFKTVIPTQYSSAARFDQGLSLVKKGNKYGLINVTGQIIAPFDYDSFMEIVQVQGDPGRPEDQIETQMGFMIDRQYIALKKGKQWGLLDKEGKIALPFEYDNISIRNNDRSILQIRKDGKLGRFDLVSKQVKFN